MPMPREGNVARGDKGEYAVRRILKSGDAGKFRLGDGLLAPRPARPPGPPRFVIFFQAEAW